MTVKEAILKSLEEIGGLTNYSDVTAHIIAKNLYDFKEAKTPQSTVSALLGGFYKKRRYKDKSFRKNRTIQKLLTADDRYFNSTKKEFCDSYLVTDTEIEEYCKQKFIPLGEEVVKE